MTDPLTLGVIGAVALVKLRTVNTDDAVGVQEMPVLSEQDFCLVISRAVSTELNISSDANRVIVAMAAYESGFGRKTAARYFNFFHMTAGSQWKGKGFPYLIEENADWEYLPDGTRKRIPQEWRMYDNVEHGIRGFWDFMGTVWNNGRYLQARNYLEQGRIDLAAREMYERGYFTLPATQYIQGWTNTLRKVNSYV